MKDLAIGAACAFAEGPRCAGGTCIDGTCQVRRAAGAACTKNRECVRDLVCEDQTCRNPSWKEPGAACLAASDRCSVGYCFTPVVVDGGAEAPRVCPAVLAVGDRCDAADESKTCPVFTGCYGGKCTFAWADPICR